MMPVAFCMTVDEARIFAMGLRAYIKLPRKSELEVNRMVAIAYCETATPDERHAALATIADYLSPIQPLEV